MSDEPSAPQDPETVPGADPESLRGHSPLDRLRGLDSAAPGNEPVRPESAERPADVPPEPAPPPPAVIAVGDRPPAYDSSSTGDRAAVPVRTEQRKKQGSFLKELPILLVIAIVLAVLIKTFLVQAFFIPSGSMEQTLQIHDRVLVNKLAFHTGSPQRGDIVVFDISGTGFKNSDAEYVACPQSNVVVSGIRAVERFVGLSTCGENDYIKRIIAVPGDTVEGIANGPVLVNGHPLTEPYVYEDNHAPFCAASNSDPEHQLMQDCANDPQPIKVPAGMYWVMGDHRSNSSDSRYNGFVPRDKLVGRAFVRILPLSRIGFLHVPKTFRGVGATAAGLGGVPAVSAPALLFPLAGGRLVGRRRRRLRARAVED
jgi:signal peptidase I